MIELHNKLIELGYENSSDLKYLYIKRFFYNYIAIYINSDNTIDYKNSGVQNNYLKKFNCDSQIMQLIRTFIVYENDILIIESYLEENKYDE